MLNPRRVRCAHRPGSLRAENAIQNHERRRCDGRRETGVAAHRACASRLAAASASHSHHSHRTQVPDLDTLLAQTEVRAALRHLARDAPAADLDAPRSSARTLLAPKIWLRSGRCHTSAPFPWTLPLHALLRPACSYRGNPLPVQRSRRSSASCCRSVRRSQRHELRQVTCMHLR